jgi:radical SAM family uncharacterized protein/radical SAM-linked protein
MENPPLLRDHPYGAFLDRVDKPARYVGGEVGSVVKPWESVEATFCLAFPDVYDIGMSHLGFKILYKLLNDDARTLAERCYAPWVDMEGELRARGLPLVSLENARPLSDFDVVGFSLQFELTYSNVLTMLDLGGIPLRAADRADSDPLVLGGGPTATHPEPVAPFFDAFVIGDGEAKASEVALAWARLRKAGVPRRDRLIALARLGAVYVPSLHATRVEPSTGLTVVERPVLPGLPFPIERSLVDLDEYPFPDDGPTGGPEAVFDRLSIEIARGCTEGCRFCQAGMIYRPVRERDPEQIVDTVLRAVKRSGQDEVSLTALSTADVSCISPLVKKVARRLANERISVGVSSLRAYGLEPELLDEIKQVRATGLTFAPEAGTQRMRDVVNKNVTEEQLHETAERVFSRGWGRMKLYFMIGLPTETDDDVRGVVETGVRTAAVGKRAARGRAAEVTVSVSTHVPKPHTPFQWAAMDSLPEVARKQQILREGARGHKAVKLKTHDANASVLEGIFARGDRVLADVLERAWRCGARFDSWDDKIKFDVWEEAFTFHRIDRSRYLGTLPIHAALPWSHIDVGLEDGFLAREYRKALQDRLSPPCGKAAGDFIHHDNAQDARADQRRLVCYDCGVACDLTQMREERISFLEKLGADKRALPVVREERTTLTGRPKDGFWYRFGYEKTGAMALLGHLDVIRELPRVLRRVGVAMVFTNGFHPKPDMSFGPALSLGVMSLDEYADVRLVPDLGPDALTHLCEAMTRASPAGLAFTGARKLVRPYPGLSSCIAGARYGIAFARSALELEGSTAEDWLAARCADVMDKETIPFRRVIDGVGRVLDVRRFLLRAQVADAGTFAAIARAGLAGDLVAIDVECAITGNGGVKAAEVAAVIAGDQVSAPPHRAVRIALFGVDHAGRFSPLDPGRGAAASQGCGGGAVHPHALDVVAGADGGGGCGRPTAVGSVCAPE